MTAKKKPTTISAELEKAVAKCLKDVMSPSADNKATLTDKMRVIDRALKLEALKAKVQDEAWGKGFFDDEGAENE